jgi:hypothetical protein
MQSTAAARYSALETDRRPYLDRARDCAELTIPSLMPPEGSSGVTKLRTPFQGIGARGVNNLASKLLLALLPPNAPMFRMLVDDFTMEQMTQKPGMRAEVEKALNKVERAVVQDIEGSTIRVTAFEVLKQLINSGNVLAYAPDKGGLKCYRLDRYVVARSPLGDVLEIILKEPVSPLALPEEILKLVHKNDKTEESKRDTNKHLDLYTWVRRKGNHFHVHQEINGQEIPGTRGKYPLDSSPWMPLRWAQIDGEDYGRSYVDEYFGDLRSLEALTQAIVEGSAAAAKVLFLVNPNGTTRMKDIAESSNLAIKAGNATDVTVLQMQKYNDFRVALEASQSIQQRLSFAFLLNTSIQRSGERVTAEEIRFMAGELENALGGVYSILSQEFQLPLVNVILDRLQRQGRLPPLPKDLVKPTITTGLEALGRGNDLNRLNTFAQNIAPLGEEAIKTYLNVGDFITRVGTSLNIDMGGLVRTEEEVQQMMQQQQMMATMQQLGPKGMDIIRDQLDPQTGSVNVAEAVQGAAEAAPGQ